VSFSSTATLTAVSSAVVAVSLSASGRSLTAVTLMASVAVDALPLESTLR
jgi:hypothetical protein